MVNPSDWEMIDNGSYNGLQKFIRATDDNHGTVEVKTVDVGGKQIIEANKRAAAEASGSMGDMCKVASIPAGVMYEWLVKFGVNAWNPDHQDAVVRLLNSGDYRYLKCREIII